LAGREAALTSEVAGTTRDVVEVRMEVQGQLVTLLDTAGIREAQDSVERLGVERARARAEAADLRVFLGEVPEGLEAMPGDLMVRGKADLAEEGGVGLAVSGLTGAGVSDLVEAIGARLFDLVAGAGDAVTERQAVALASAAGSLEEAASVLRVCPAEPEIVSALVRQAVQSLDEMVGRIGVEDILGEIFAQFCIGK
jgi:tRNA modification GTPase